MLHRPCHAPLLSPCPAMALAPAKGLHSQAIGRWCDPNEVD
jgi:hypothetical protein